MSLLIECGGVKDIENIAGNITLTSCWKNGASKLEFTILPGLAPVNGSYLTFSPGADMFAGRVFAHRRTQDKRIQVTAYDQLRYLKAKDTVMRKQMSLTQFVDVIAANLQLRVSGLANSVIPLDDYLFDNQTYLDMAYQSISDNLMANGYYYCLYDRFGALALTDLLDMRLPLIVGEQSLGFKYEYEVSIDSDTYNQVKLAYDNKKTGKRDIYIARDGNNIGKWGVLQHFEKVTSGTDAQLIDKANILLKLKNRETVTLTMSALGDVRVRGGSGVRVILNDCGIDLWAIVDKAVHKWSNGIHTMDLTLVIDGSL